MDQVVWDPAVYVDGQKRTTIVIRATDRTVYHIPMDSVLALAKTQAAVFLEDRKIMPNPDGHGNYPPSRAAMKYLNTTLPITEQARRLLRQVASGSAVTAEDVRGRPAVTTPTKEEPKMAKAKKKAVEAEAEVIPLKKSRKKKAEAAEESSGRRGREPAMHDGLKIKLLTKENPKREGTASYDRFALYSNGLTVGDYISAGGKRSDIAWDVNKGFIEVR